jgi:hypothetical protein
MKIKITKKQLLKESYGHVGHGAGSLEENIEGDEEEEDYSDLFESRHVEARVKQILLEELRASIKKHAPRKPKFPLNMLEDATKRLKRR